MTLKSLKKVRFSVINETVMLNMYALLICKRGKEEEPKMTKKPISTWVMRKWAIETQEFLHFSYMYVNKESTKQTEQR